MTTSLFSQDIKIVTIDRPPFIYKEDDQIKGLATQVVRNIFTQAQVEYSIAQYSWSKAYSLLEKNENTMLYMISKKSERTNLFKWIGPIVVPYNMYFYKLKSRSDIQINALEDTRIYRIGVIKNASNHFYLKKYGFEDGHFLQTVPSVRMNIKKLLKDRVDLIVSNDFTLPLLLENEGLPFDTIQKAYSINKIEAGYLAFNKETSPELLNKLDKAFNYLKLHGDLHNKINLKHLGYHHNKK